MKDYLDSVERIQHLTTLEGPLPTDVEPEILEQEYKEGIGTPPEPTLVIHEEDDEDEEVDQGEGEEKRSILMRLLSNEDEDRRPQEGMRTR